MLSVSIVTISQYSRKEFLKILAECIKQQDYTNIKEWIIVDTSLNGYQKTNKNLKEIIEKFGEDKSIPKIVYYQSTKKKYWRMEK